MISEIWTLLGKNWYNIDKVTYVNNIMRVPVLISKRNVCIKRPVKPICINVSPKVGRDLSQVLELALGSPKPDTFAPCGSLNFVTISYMKRTVIQRTVLPWIQHFQTFFGDWAKELARSWSRLLRPGESDRGLPERIWARRDLRIFFSNNYIFIIIFSSNDILVLKCLSTLYRSKLRTCFICGQNGKSSSHDGNGCNRWSTEAGQVKWCHGPSGIRHHLFD